MKILLNAESFGFGPSASMANIFNQIKDFDFIERIDYVGNGHSLDLQKKLSYNQFFEVESDDEIKNIVKNYDVFITALDFRKATIAKECGVKVVIYDTLLWYWRKKPEIIKYCDYYIAQDFYGVKECIEDLGIKNYSIVSPVLNNCVHKRIEEHILINFGGLENPLWDISITVEYINKMLLNILPLLGGESIKVVCSKSHVPYFEHYDAKNLSYEEMQKTLNKSKYVIATPGLGNIYEIAKYEIPSLFLPPANDSQGQQLLILKEKGLVLNYVDWEDLGDKIDYNLEQEEVLEKIKRNIFKNINFQNLFKEKMFDNKNLKLKELLCKFGIDGSKQIKEILEKKLKELE